MRKYEQKTVTKNYDSLVETTCDLCGAIAKSGKWESSSWSIDEVEIEVTVRQKEGHSYPDGGNGTKYEIDMCPKCFKNKLVSWLISQGAKIKQIDWDW